MANKNEELPQQYCNYIVQVSLNNVFDGKQTELARTDYIKGKM